jgi:hypothetical protein
VMSGLNVARPQKMPRPIGRMRSQGGGYLWLICVEKQTHDYTTPQTAKRLWILFLDGDSCGQLSLTFLKCFCFI